MTRLDIVDLSVSEIMERWPDTVGLFIRLDLSCVGCPIGRFHTPGEAAAAHHMPDDNLLAGLTLAVGGDSAQQARAASVADKDQPVGVADEELLPPAFHQPLGLPGAEDT